MVDDSAQRGDRGVPRRRLQPHRRGERTGPTLSFRGLDNAAYYHLADDPRFTYDFTGTGNSLNLGHPRTLQLVTDSLRYWVDRDARRRFPVRSRTRARPASSATSTASHLSSTSCCRTRCWPASTLIAEPWDIGQGGYDVGNFPVNWSEWNGRYRDTVRRFWKGTQQQIGRGGHAAERVERPVQLGWPASRRKHQLRHRARRLHACRSGQLRRQAQRGQPSRTTPTGTTTTTAGTAASRVPTDDQAILAPARPPEAQPHRHAAAQPGDSDDPGRRRAVAHAERQQQRVLPGQRAVLARLGSRRRRRAFLEFVRRVIRLRASEPVFRRRTFFQGRPIHGGIKDLYWLESVGTGDDRPGLDTGWAECFGHAAERRRDRRDGCLRQRNRRRFVPAHLQRLRRRGRVPPPSAGPCRFARAGGGHGPHRRWGRCARRFLSLGRALDRGHECPGTARPCTVAELVSIRRNRPRGHWTPNWISTTHQRELPDVQQADNYRTVSDRETGFEPATARPPAARAASTCSAG